MSQVYVTQDAKEKKRRLTFVESSLANVYITRWVSTRLTKYYSCIHKSIDIRSSNIEDLDNTIKSYNLIFENNQFKEIQCEYSVVVETIIYYMRNRHFHDTLTTVSLKIIKIFYPTCPTLGAKWDGILFSTNFILILTQLTLIFVEIFPHLARPGSRAARARFIIWLVFKFVERQLVYQN